MAAPVNTVLPAISGSATVGSILATTDGTWTGGVTTYTYQWYRSNSNVAEIVGATNNTYVVNSLDSGHVLYVVVTATNNTGSTAAQSVSTTIVLGAWFVDEDGTAKTTSNSYISVEDANLYHAVRNHTLWTQLPPYSKQSLLVDATDYLVQMYRRRWKGYRKTGTQALDWPRTFVYLEPFVHGVVGTYPFLVLDTIVPVEVKNACAELALRAATADLAPDLTQGVVSETVGPLSTTYDRFTPQSTRYRAIEAMLAPYLNGSEAVISLTRS